MSNRLKVLTWHIHGSYLYYLSQTECDFYVPTKEGKPEGYGGRSGSMPWPDNLYEIHADEVGNTHFDCIIFQSKKNYTTDQYDILSDEQKKLPKIFIEHDPPREVPTDTKHIVDDPDVLTVHVTHFNNLMWDNNSTPSKVIYHGVMTPPNVRYTGELEKGVVVINGIKKRGRRVGADILEKVRVEVPLDIYGMESDVVGGQGEIPLKDLHAHLARYRFFFNPIRYTSLGLAVCEAMQIGMPIIGLATTEMPVVIKNDVNGFVHTDVNALIAYMKELLSNKEKAMNISTNAYNYAQDVFGIERFKKDWLNTIEWWVEKKKSNL